MQTIMTATTDYGGIALLITAIGGVILAFSSFGAMLLSWYTVRKVNDVASAIRSVDSKVDEVHSATNSKMDKLLKVVGEVEHAKGVKQGEASEKEHSAAQGNPPLPVADDRTARAAERSANAQERTADAAESHKPG